MTDDPTRMPDPSQDDPTLAASSPGHPREAGDDSPEIGTTIGPYKLVSRLGEGGMGEVFAADQTDPIKRRVALKVIKPGMDSRAVVARFEAERQALAIMDHPCIARVFDAGTTSRGRPYFVMEYVDGVPITAYCDQRRLTTRERLELLIQVCEGVQHAHQKAVIHRDLKPSNILVTEVDGRPVPKIIDFGVAKATEQSLTEGTLFTAQGQLVGTPEYMSPEQAAARGQDIDTRSDVYALGVVLYELLAGTLPFSSQTLRQAGLAEIQRIICEDDPPRPSTRLASLGADATTVADFRHDDPRHLRRLLRGDLDWITMKAMAKERERRYDTANGLAMDLRRFLQNEPVLASPPSAGYRLRKLVRRNRGAFAALGLFVGILTVSAVVSTSLYVRAERESQRARREGAKSEQVSAFLKDMLAGVGPAAARGRDTTMLQEILADTEARLASDLGDQPAVEAALREVLATTYLDLGEYERARADAQRSVELKSREYGPTHHETAVAVGLAGRIDLFLGEMGAADSLMAWSDSVISDQLGPGADAALEIRAARTEGLSYTGNLDLAAELAEDVLRRLRGTPRWGNDATLTALYSLAQVRSDRQEFAGADSLYVELIELLTDRLGPDHPNTLTARASRGLNLTYADRLDEAEQVTVAALADIRRVLGDEHRQTLITLNNLAITYNRMGRLDDTEDIYREANAISARTMGPRHPETLAGVVNLATFLARNDRCEEAIEMASEAVAGLTEVMGPDYVGCGFALRSRAGCYRKVGDLDAAARDLAEAHRVFLGIFGPEDPRVHEYAAELADIHAELGNEAEAERWRAGG